MNNCIVAPILAAVLGALLAMAEGNATNKRLYYGTALILVIALIVVFVDFWSSING